MGTSALAVAGYASTFKRDAHNKNANRLYHNNKEVIDRAFVADELGLINLEKLV